MDSRPASPAIRRGQDRPGSQRGGHPLMREQSTIDRFMRHVSPEPNSGCWLWTGCAVGDGYGRFRDGGKTHDAHRFGYRIFRGEIPDEMQLDHLCRVRCCVNPDHLDVVSQSENIRRGRSSNREKTHCPNGHPYTPENTIQVKSRANRMCRACHRRRDHLRTRDRSRARRAS